MKKNSKIGIVFLILVVVAAIFFAMRPSSDEDASPINLTGAGSTFAIPLLDACKAGYTSETGNTYTYSGGGSGAGRSASDMGIGDFNFSDTPHTANTRLATVIHIPVIAAPIAVMYNLNLAKPLNLSPSTIAGIFAGTIANWNDPAVVADNPGVQLPMEKIHVIYRADSSGTSGNFTAFLYGMAPAIWSNPGSNDFKASFPGNIDSSSNLGRIVSAAGSSGVSTLAGSTPYSITYAEKNYAEAAGLSEANIKNLAGNFVAPDADGTSAFLGAAAVDPNGFLTFDYQTMEADAYPLGIVSYALVDTESKHPSEVKSLLTYLLSPACSNANPALGYSTITGSLYDLDLAQIAKIG
jgi:phosphate transport system substrate-binding protein